MIGLFYIKKIEVFFYLKFAFLEKKLIGGGCARTIYFYAAYFPIPRIYTGSKIINLTQVALARENKLFYFIFYFQVKRVIIL